MSDLIELLSRCEFLRDVGPRTLELLAEPAVERRTAPGDVIFRQGEERQAFFVVIDGQVEVQVEEGSHTGEVTILLGRDDPLGEAGLLEPGLHTASARTPEASHLIEVPLAPVRRALANEGRAALSLFNAVGRLIMRRLQYSAYRRAGWDRVYQGGGARQEHDLLGDRDVPADARYGVQTLRALENFPITGVRLGHFPALVRGLAAVKMAAARANRDTGLLSEERADAIDHACQEILEGHWHGHFVVDMVQGGAGTSTNMNANEVIANRALELLGHERGEYAHCHPNNHVNLSQSTNDAYPTAVRVAAVAEQRTLSAALGELEEALRAKAEELTSVLKMGRTQLQDAVPMTLGQEFEAFAETVHEDIERLDESARLLLEINLGGTAIGTGLNAHPEYRDRAVAHLREITGQPLVSAKNLIEATPDTGAFVHFSGVLKRIAVKLSKLCNDLRLLSSGPRCGIGEIRLPPMQPGSSIMPGKVNPVIPEVVNQVAFHVIGNDVTITMAAEAGQLQLNVMEPIIVFNLFESLSMLTESVKVLTRRCITGITADTERCRQLVEQSIGVITALVPSLGYERSSAVAKEALESGLSVRQILERDGDLDGAQIDQLLSPERMLSNQSR